MPVLFEVCSHSSWTGPSSVLHYAVIIAEEPTVTISHQRCHYSILLSYKPPILAAFGIFQGHFYNVAYTQS